MRIGCGFSVGVATLIGLSLTALPAPAQQGPGYKAPRLTGTLNPDLNGLWQAMNEANWDIQAHAAHGHDDKPCPSDFAGMYSRR